MIEFIDKILKENNIELDTMELPVATKIFWEILTPHIVRTKVAFVDTEFPEAYWYDWYELMSVANSKWWRAISEVWDRPYVILMHKDKELMQYIEWDIYYYKVKEDDNK